MGMEIANSLLAKAFTPSTIVNPRNVHRDEWDCECEDC
jgi:hypothetical protein